MAENYFVQPLTADAAAKLAALRMPHPALSAEPRSPTPQQVLGAVAGLTALESAVDRRPEKRLIRIDLNPPGTSNARPAGSGTEITLFDVGGEGTPCRVTFRGGTPALVAAVADRIAAECGPLIVWPASGAALIVCTGEAGPAGPDGIRS